MGVVTRRALLLAGGASLASTGGAVALPVPPAGTMAFRLMRHGSPIGTHTLTFRNDGDMLDVDIAVEVVVKFGPIPLVRYTHQNRETWHAGRLVGLTSRTDKNGTKLHMAARRTGSGLAVEGAGTAPYIAPEEALPTTYWNPRMLHVPMIGTQDGALVRPIVTQDAIERIRLASGDLISTKHYRLSGDLDLELWYDNANTWAGMRFTVNDGSVVSYERL